MTFVAGFEKVGMAGALSAAGRVLKTVAKKLPKVGVTPKAGFAGIHKGVSTVSGANRGTASTYQYANSLKSNAQAARFTRRYEKAAARPVSPPVPSAAAQPKPAMRPQTVGAPKPTVQPQAAVQPKPAVQSKPAAQPKPVVQSKPAAQSKPAGQRKSKSNRADAVGEWGGRTLLPAAAGAAGGYLLGSSNSNSN